MILWGIQIGLFKDNEAIKAFFILRFHRHRFEKQILLKRTPFLPVKGPELEDPAMLVKMPEGKPIEPEDIISGNIELEIPLEPEDIGGNFEYEV